MKLTIATPLAIIVESDGIAHLRAEDETGAFGILPGHADFLTALSVSVATWRDRDGGEHHAALRGGMLEVRDGDEIAIATREAIVSVDLHQLETEVLAAFRRGIEDERVARTDTQRLYLAAIRQICRFLRSERIAAIPGGPGLADIDSLELLRRTRKTTTASTRRFAGDVNGRRAGSARASRRSAKIWE